MNKWEPNLRRSMEELHVSPESQATSSSCVTLQTKTSSRPSQDDESVDSILPEILAMPTYVKFDSSQQGEAWQRPVVTIKPMGPGQCDGAFVGWDDSDVTRTTLEICRKHRVPNCHLCEDMYEALVWRAVRARAPKPKRHRVFCHTVCYLPKE